MDITCFKCGIELDIVWDDEPNIPYAGTLFTSMGHYGSTVFDPNAYREHKVIEIAICDECIKNFTNNIKLYENGSYTRKFVVGD